MQTFNSSALLTDLYELAMLQAYFKQQMNQTAVFEFFVRKLPENRQFLLAAGLEQVVSYLESLRFSAKDLTWLRESGKFDSNFISSLQDFHFTGDIDAMPEGTVFFENEPILRITAPLREAQLIESRVINLLHYQTMIASKAVRCVLAAPGKHLIDFGMRRAHGAEASLLSARASYLAGFDGTATTEAGHIFGIPAFGTMAHSFIQAHEYEIDAFTAFARTFPDSAVLLIDTYDTEAAAHEVCALHHHLKTEGIHIQGVRIDSGDLGKTAKRVRTILDDGNCPDVRIFASSSLDEYELQKLAQEDAPIDGFGIGTKMNTSADAPYLDCAYKLEEYAGEPRMKLSPGKETWPSRKQVFRYFNLNGKMSGDTLALESEKITNGTPLLFPVMRRGKLLQPPPSLSEIRAYVRAELAALPSDMHKLEKGSAYPVTPSESLQRISDQTRELLQLRARKIQFT